MMVLESATFRAVVVDDVGKFAVRRVFVDPRQVLRRVLECDPCESHVGDDLGHIGTDIGKAPTPARTRTP